MVGATRAVRVFAYSAPVDMRKGFDGLAALVEQQLGHDLLRGDVYLFVGRSCRRAKVLYFDGTGLCLLSKRLEKGRFPRPWERATDGRAVSMTLSELTLFLEGALIVGRLPLAPAALERKDLALQIRT
jgi:transposase